jgi:hypothetical protein
MARSPSPTTPRWPTLAGLGVVVLGVHLWLLAGEWPARLQSAGPPPRPTLTAEPTGPEASTSPAPAPTARAVTVSQVRWITAQATPATPAPVKARPIPAKPAVPAEDPANKALPSDTLPTAETPVTGNAATASAPEPKAEPATEQAAIPLAQAPAEPSPSTGAPAPPLPPARAPGSTQLTYDVSGSIRGVGYTAQGTLDWTVNDGRYDARMSVRMPLIGSRVQTSTGRLGPAGLQPERFADKARSERAAHFEPEQQRIRFSNNAPEAALQPGAQDRLSVFLQLASRFNAAPQPAGQVIELQVAGTGDADVWRFLVGEETMLNLPAGELRTRRLVREAPGPRDTQVEMWLAPALDHLPVRIRLTQASGDQVDQQLSRLP